MNQNVTHIIHRQRYEVKVASQQHGRWLQQQLQQFNLQSLLPELNNRLNEWFAKSDEVITIEKLDIDIGKIHSNGTSGEWLEKIVYQLEQKLKPLSNRQKVETLLQEEIQVKKTETSFHASETFLYFLVNGLLPQASIYRSVADVIEALQQMSMADLSTLKARLLADSNRVMHGRLALLSKEQLLFFIHIFLPELSLEDWNNWLKETDEWSIIQVLNASLETDYPTTLAIQNKQLVFFIQELMQSENDKLSLSFNSIKEDARKQTVSWLSMLEGIEGKENVSEINRAERKEKGQSICPDEELLTQDGSIVANAGICLVSPYLPALFKAVQFTNKADFSSVYVQQKAILLLHFLTTGEEIVSEEKLVLAKLLCGWPIQMPLTEKVILTEAEKEEANELLHSMIEHWQALKNTSPDGLRQAFLQRSGKLSDKEDSFLLQVEHQTLDILLDSIPWQFRLIRLPWMKKSITVEWY